MPAVADTAPPSPAKATIDALCRVLAATVRITRIPGPDALSWASTRKLPAIDGLTALEAIRAGREAEVMRYLGSLPTPRRRL